MDLSFLFVNYNSWRLCAGALESLRLHPPLGRDGSPLEYEVIVVDNASPIADPDGQAAVERLVEELGGTVVLHGENGGYAKGMNLAYARSRGRMIVVCNPDILFAADAMTRLVEHLESDPSLGAVAPAVFGDPTLLVHLPIHILPTVGDLLRITLGTVSETWNRRYSERRTRAALQVWGVEDPVEEEMFGGCCFLMPRELIEEIGFFDERYPLYYEDTDLSLRIRAAGRRILRVGDSRVVHLYDRSSGTNREEAFRRLQTSRERFYAKWYGLRGRAANAFCAWLLATRWARKRAARIASRPTRSFDIENGRPVLVLPRECVSYVIEIAYEPFLFLTAATFGSGDRWVPGDVIVSELHREAWMRAVDVSGPEPVELGIWRYEPPAQPIPPMERWLEDAATDASAASAARNDPANAPASPASPASIRDEVRA